MTVALGREEQKQHGMKYGQKWMNLADLKNKEQPTHFDKCYKQLQKINIST